MRRPLHKSVLVVGVGTLCVLYLINPTFGVFELIPDNIPLVGNLDEATATVLLVSALAYFGIDVYRIFEREKKPKNPQKKPPKIEIINE
jgi:uncharacterized membrane protein YkvA (DUF1232 family)